MPEVQRKIALIEINTHAEVLQNFLNILSELPFSVNLYVIEKVWRRVKLKDDLKSQPNVTIIKSAFQINSFFKERIDEINTNDIIFINTLETHFYIFSILKFTSPVICRVHNSNTFFNPSHNLNFNLNINYIIKDLIYILKRQIFNLDIIYRPRFIKNQVNFFCFPNQTTTNFALENSYVSTKNIIKPIPLVYKDVSLNKVQNINSGVFITIVGSIDKRRRNYESVLNAFRMLIPELNEKVELFLLGKPVGNYGRNVIKKFKKLECKNFKLHSYSQFVPHEEFSRVMSKCDFQIIPVNKYARYKIFRELYGKTKISGNVNDIILYETPALIPAYYPLDSELKRITSDYVEVTDLKNLILQWIKTKEYKDFPVKETMKNFQMETIKNQVMSILKSI